MLVVLALAVAMLGVHAPAASAGSAIQLKRDTPAWYTDALHQQVLSAGADGIRVAEERLNLDCPGYQDSGVGAAGCIVSPYGCTANNIFSDGASYYVGTARHCVDGIGTPLVMQVDPVTLAEVGTVVSHTPGDGEPGEDFALIRLYPEVVAKWGVDPAIPVVGGPQGVYEGCGVQAVKHYGHGYGVAVAQGKPSAGLATNWHNDGYGWTGFGLPGDSGSPVVVADNRSAGNFTHLIVDTRDYLGSNLAGMRMTAILDFLGGGIQLVNADGSLSGAGRTSC